MFSRILIANRGEIACRIMRTARRMGIYCVVPHTLVDAGAMHVRHADLAVAVRSQCGYLDQEAMVAIALETGAEAVHPGYGFLSENPEFAEAVRSAGLAFIGPSAESIRAMGLKDAAKACAEEAGVPVVPGYHGEEQVDGHLAAEADAIGYPVLVKARAGGGGKGMRLVEAPGDFLAALASARNESLTAFGDDGVIIERYVKAPRHVEVQLLGDLHGNRRHLFERDCTMQRRHQKVIEEAPAPHMPQSVRLAMCNAALRLAEAIDYSGAGTVEFIVDGSRALREDAFWFMEMNTRLQVEHPVSEAVTGIDLVEWQIRIAAGEPLAMRQEDIRLDGHAVEARIYAEDPVRDFMPAPGEVHGARYAEGVRVDAGVEAGDKVPLEYDPMVAKVIAHGEDRNAAFARLAEAVSATHVLGTASNLDFLERLARHPSLLEATRKAGFDTGFIAREMEELTRVRLPHFAVAMACIALLDRDALEGGAWRIWGKGRIRMPLEINGRRHVAFVEIDRAGGVTVLTGDDLHEAAHECGARQTAELVSVERGRRSVSAVVDGQPVHMSALRRDDMVSLSGHGVRLTARIPDLLQRRTREQDADGIAAPMTGVIQAVEAGVGEKVEEGRTLVVMAAMKMEYALAAPRDGVVSEVHCAPGDSVAEGARLVNLEEDGDGEEG